MKAIELFCGKGTLTKLCRAKNYQAVSVDIRKRKGICEPDIRADIRKISPADFPFIPDLIYAGFPCTAFSHAAGDYYFKNGQFKETASIFLDIARATFRIVESYPGVTYFLENPVGHARNWNEMKQFLARTNGVIKTIHLSAYGFATTKPTNIFTNAIDWRIKPLQRYGRGAKCSRDFSNLTICSRQATPEKLYSSIIEYMEGKPEAKQPYQLNLSI